jgi:hypothetical protein
MHVDYLTFSNFLLLPLSYDQTFSQELSSQRTAVQAHHLRRETKFRTHTTHIKI